MADAMSDPTHLRRRRYLRVGTLADKEMLTGVRSTAEDRSPNPHRVGWYWVSGWAEKTATRSRSAVWIPQHETAQ
jgi:hypothetical protein